MQLKGSSLLYSLAIAITIGLIILAMMTHLSLNQKIINLKIQENQVILNVESGLEIALSKNGELTDSLADLFGNNKDSIRISATYYGVYKLLNVEAKTGMQVKHRYALAAYTVDSINRYALYLQDLGKPISICGEVKITGDCYLPKAGMTRSNIEGKAFSENKFFIGKSDSSNKKLPSIDTNLTNKIVLPIHLDQIKPEDIYSEAYLSHYDTLYNSFANTTKYLYSEQELNLSDVKINGNVKIISTKGIVVDESCTLEQVILMAPKIIIEKNFKGRLQAFASDSLVVNENCHLYYPSALGLIRNKKNDISLTIAENTIIEGVILGYDANFYSGKKFELTLKKGSIIEGQIYCNNAVGLNGTVNGLVMCKTVYYTSTTNTYQDQLMNTTINGNLLSKYFGGLRTDYFKGKYVIAKWLL